MGVLRSHLKSTSAEFKRNRAHHEALRDALRGKLETVRRGGVKHAVDLHRSRGKLLPRERIERLLDPDTPFFELSPLAAEGLYGGEVPSGGIVTGIGSIAGRECVIVANDATVKG